MLQACSPFPHCEFRGLTFPGTLRAGYILANPPFNPAERGTNFAWPRKHSGFIHHLAPQGMAGFVLANGSMSSNQSGEGTIRQGIIKADLIDCMVA